MMNLSCRPLLPGILAAGLLSACSMTDSEIQQKITGTWNCDGDMAVMETYFSDGRYVKFVSGKAYAQRALDRVDHYLEGRYRVRDRIVSLDLRYHVSGVLARRAGLGRLQTGPVRRRLHVRDIDADNLHLHRKALGDVFCRRIAENRTGEKYEAFARALKRKIRSAVAREKALQHKSAAIRTMIAEKRTLLGHIRKIDGVLRRGVVWAVMQEIENSLPASARLVELRMEGGNARAVLVAVGRSAAPALVRRLNGSKVVSSAQVFKEKSFTRGKDTLVRSVVHFSLAPAQNRNTIYLIRLSDEADAYAQHRRQYLELQAVYRRINRYLFSRQEAEQAAGSIKEWLKRYSSSVQRFTLRQMQRDGLHGYRIDFVAQAKYVKVRRLMLKLVSGRKPVVIDAISLYRRGGDGPGVLRLAMRLFLYQRMPERPGGTSITARSDTEEKVFRRYRLVTLLPYPDYTDKNDRIRNPFRRPEKKTENPD